MRTYLSLIVIAALTASPAFAKGRSSSSPKTVHVRNYTTKGGKSVSSHQRSAPTR